MSKAQCLLIDDSEDIHFLIKKVLSDLCEVQSSFSLEDARKQFELRHYDIIIIDLMLRDQNGMELLKEFKGHHVSKKTRYFILTAKDSVVDEAKGHDMGVDEYLKKPVDREVLKAVVRKNLKLLKEDAPSVIEASPFYILPDNHQAFIETPEGREELQLTVKEFKLLVKFITNPDKTFSREDLFNQVWENDSNSTMRTIDMHVSSLRKKLKEHGALIKTIHQVGYKYSNS